MRQYRGVLTVHRTSALILLVFLAVHLLNHLMALGGVKYHIAYMDLARMIYRSPIIEPVIVLAVITQSVTGIIQLRQTWKRWPTLWHKIQIFSGLYLLFFIINHTIAIFITIRTLLNIDSNFYSAAAGLNIAPLHWFFIPYYALGVMALFAHIASYLYFRLSYDTATRRKIAYSITLSGVAISTLIIAAFSGVFYEIELPENVRTALEKMIG